MSKKLHEIASRVAKSERKKGGISISLVDDKTIRMLNKRFRKIDRATDVLSFYFGEHGVLGDIVISLDSAKRNAKRFKESLGNELKRLVVHAALHLLGYDHFKKSDRMLMRQKEDIYAEKIC